MYKSCDATPTERPPSSRGPILAAAQEPDPHNMAGEIALHLVLDAAAGIVADETPELELFTGGMPKSRFDCLG